MAEAQPRNYVQVMITLRPEDLEALDRLAADIAEPGGRPNRSAAVRHAVRVARKKIRKNPESAIDSQ